MFLADYHTHTLRSVDGSETLYDMALSAKNAGMSELCITDHCDMVEWKEYKVTDDGLNVIKNVIADNESEKDKLCSLLTVKKGIELGEAHLCPEQALEFSKYEGLDFIIGSLHVLREEGDFFQIKFTSEDQCYELFDKYMDQSLEIADLNCFDVMGHIGYCSRPMSKYGFQAKLDLWRYHDKIYTLLKKLIENGKGVEINTSGLRCGVGFFPNEDILKLYKELGGEIITVGSDAHFTENVGQNIKDAYELLSGLGFKYVSIFSERKPEFIKL